VTRAKRQRLQFAFAETDGSDLLYGPLVPRIHAWKEGSSSGMLLLLPLPSSDHVGYCSPSLVAEHGGKSARKMEGPNNSWRNACVCVWVCGCVCVHIR